MTTWSYDYGRVRAFLGPTNTGKTYRTIERMLAYKTGRLGFPLRLLAREVYDKVAARVGADKVALITGEERITPHNARYEICTVESMPERPVEFLAVDEIQLATHPERGHVFTDRILHARGLRETIFLGSDTMRDILEELVPAVEVEVFPRFSKLRWSGSRKLRSLPPRTAVVAYRTRSVYELAGQVKASQGGVALVFGALSPATRNAQVAMFEEGEVATLVATDAIGMGLNLDLHHVAIAEDKKFDGHSWRDLRAEELAQVAGRAGRYKRDGTFGVTAGLEPLDPDLIAQIEEHRFAPVRRLEWRSNDLSYLNPHELLDSLHATPSSKYLRRAATAPDESMLENLLRRHPEWGSLGPERTRLLWTLCQLPDFGNVGEGHHAQFLERIWSYLSKDLPVAEDWIRQETERLGRADRDIGRLMAAIGGMRTWTYVSWRADWLDHAEHWQDITTRLEATLSNRLHDALTARFVDRRRRVFEVGGQVHVETTPDGRVRAGGVEVGRLQGLAWKPSAEVRNDPAILRKAGLALAPLLKERAADLIGSPDGAFRLDHQGIISWDEGRIGRLKKGRSVTSPGLQMDRNPWLDGPIRSQVQQRAQRWLKSALEGFLSPVTNWPTGVRAGVGFALLQGAGACRLADAPKGAVDAKHWRWLKRHGVVRVGKLFAVPKMLEQEAIRSALWSIWSDKPMEMGLLPRKSSEPLGYVKIAGRWLRIDLAASLRGPNGDEIADGMGLQAQRKELMHRGRSRRVHKRSRR